MKKYKTSKISKKMLLLIAIVLIVIFLIYLLQVQKKDPVNWKTLNQGTQMPYNDISIGLTNIDNGTGWLAIRKDGNAEEPLKKSVVVGDKFDVYGYTIEVKSVGEKWYSQPLSGSSNGTIKFIINKK